MTMMTIGILPQEKIRERLLAQTTGRSASNLSRTLKTMSNYGLTEMQASSQRRLRPVAKATEFQILMTTFSD